MIIALNIRITHTYSKASSVSYIYIYVIIEKAKLFIFYKYFAVLYRSFVNILKQSHVTSNKNHTGIITK